ncbi:MAG: polyprenol monophosphomannose synthase [Cyclonatronaceae bacterium]
MSNESLVIIPTYNEAHNIGRILTRLMALNTAVDVLVVDDGSPDGTASVVEERQKEFPGRIHLLSRKGKLGLGTAYVAGFKFALDYNYRYIIEMDADFSHDPDDVPRLLRVLQNNESDVAVGSRYHNGISIVNWPLSRLILSYSANLYARIVTGLPIKDTTAGFKAFKREVLQAINLDRIRSNGYSFQIEMHYRALKAGFRLKEVSIIFRERTEGVSKMSKSIIIEAIWMVWALKFRSLVNRL